MKWLSSQSTSAPQLSKRQSSKSLESLDDLNGLTPRYVRTLAVELDTLSLLDRMCPVLFEDKSVAVFVETASVYDDQVEALLQLLRQTKFKLQEFPVYTVANPVLFALGKSLRFVAQRPASPGTDMRSDRPALLKAFDDIIDFAFECHASDVHFNVDLSRHESRVYFTVDGVYLCPERYASVSTNLLLEMLSLVWMEIRGGNGAVFDARLEQQGRVERRIRGTSLVLRWASLASDRGPSVCLRLLATDATAPDSSLASLGFLSSHREAFERVKLIDGGAVILSGTVGSGKSTTIAALMRSIPTHRKIITLEDPVEYVIPNALQNTISRSFSESDETVFDTKLKTIKRSAMNDLLIGEIRDLAGARAFTDLAGSGANLYTTVHARSSVAICERLSSSMIGVELDFLATPGVIKILVHQMLLPQLCVCCLSLSDIQLDNRGQVWQCSRGRDRTIAWLTQWVSNLATHYSLDPRMLRFRNPQGCSSCREMQLADLWGLAGRTVIAEMIEPLREPEFLKKLKARDGLGLYEWFHSRSKTPWASEDMDGKSIFACAIHKMSIGLIDPRAVEAKFGGLVCES